MHDDTGTHESDSEFRHSEHNVPRANFGRAQWSGPTSRVLSRSGKRDLDDG
jgi:hypothetical protein